MKHECVIVSVIFFLDGKLRIKSIEPHLLIMHGFCSDYVLNTLYECSCFKPFTQETNDHFVLMYL